MIFNSFEFCLKNFHKNAMMPFSRIFRIDFLNKIRRTELKAVAAKDAHIRDITSKKK